MEPTPDHVSAHGFVQRTGKAVVAAGFLIIAVAGWVAVDRRLGAALVGLPIGLFFVAYGIDVVGHPEERRVLGPTELSQWVLSLLARLPGTIDDADERDGPSRRPDR